MHKVQDDPARAQQVLKFFSWDYAHGAKLAEQLVYVPFPQSVVKLIEASWSTIKSKDGKPVWK